jgi:hypothetical protein
MEAEFYEHGGEEYSNIESVSSRREEITSPRKPKLFRSLVSKYTFGSIPKGVTKANPIDQLFHVTKEDLHKRAVKENGVDRPKRDTISHDMRFYKIGKLPPPSRHAFGSIPANVIHWEKIANQNNAQVNKKKAHLDLLRRSQDQDQRKSKPLKLSDIMILRTQGYFHMTSKEIIGVEKYMFKNELRFSPKCIYDAFVQEGKQNALAIAEPDLDTK